MAQKRARFQGPIADLVQTVKPFVTSVSWLKYTEKLSGPRDASVLVAHKSFLQALSKLDPALNFTKEQMTACFQQLAKELAFQELGNEEETKDWYETMLVSPLPTSPTCSTGTEKRSLLFD